MAAAIVTVTTALYPPGNRRWMVVKYTPSTSYVTGGESMAASVFGLQAVDDVIPSPGGEDGTRIFTYNGTTGKLMIFTAVSTEAANASDQSSKPVNLLVIGL